ncbi:MAG: hypothetical protein IANPNBLG_02918 [Bryobacteraceae bacterium]|nr:hypothetical protein [Bryobacteraceae bacterium]
MKLAFLTLTAAALFAQNSVRGPVVGWVYDSASASVRSVLGIPGASTMGAGPSASRAAIAGNRGYAISINGENHQPALLDLRTGESKDLDAAPGAAAATWSASGGVAAITYPGENKLILMKGFPEEPAVALTLDLASEGMPQSLSIADDGEGLLAVYDSGVLVFDGAGNRWKLNFEAQAREASFLEGSHDALIAADGGVWLVSDATAGASSRRVWEGNAVSAAASSNRNLALIVNDGGGIVAVNLKTGEARTVDCGCAATTLSRMSQGVFRISELNNGPLWLVDLNGQDPRAVFVPADVRSE